VKGGRREKCGQREKACQREERRKSEKEAIKLVACRIKKIDHQQYCQSVIVWRR
jgi:hypothetical protein